MKKYVSVLIACIWTITSLLPFSNSLHAQQDEVMVQAFLKDNDWKIIRDSHLEIMDRLVNYKGAFTSATLNSESGFLNILGMTKDQYLGKSDLVRNAARRLMSRYGVNNACDVCLPVNDPIGKFQAILTSFQSNKEKYNQYRSGLLEQKLADEPTRCCGLRFYLCCTVCAATIAAFPAYLACCALCFDTYCCKLK